jgi:hypothetical protein
MEVQIAAAKVNKYAVSESGDTFVSVLVPFDFLLYISY